MYGQRRDGFNAAWTIRNKWARRRKEPSERASHPPAAGVKDGLSQNLQFPRKRTDSVTRAEMLSPSGGTAILPRSPQSAAWRARYGEVVEANRHSREPLSPSVSSVSCPAPQHPQAARHGLSPQRHTQCSLRRSLAARSNTMAMKTDRTASLDQRRCGGPIIRVRRYSLHKFACVERWG